MSSEGAQLLAEFRQIAQGDGRTGQATSVVSVLAGLLTDLEEICTGPVETWPENPINFMLMRIGARELRQMEKQRLVVVRAAETQRLQQAEREAQQAQGRAYAARQQTARDSAWQDQAVLDLAAELAAHEADAVDAGFWA